MERRTDPNRSAVPALRGRSADPGGGIGDDLRAGPGGQVPGEVTTRTGNIVSLSTFVETWSAHWVNTVRPVQDLEADFRRGSGTVVGPPEEQLIRIATTRAVRADTVALVMAVAGEIDIHTITLFRTAVKQALEEVSEVDGGVLPLVVDLSRVTFLGSSGLRALVDATLAAPRHGGPLRIVVDHNRPVVHPIELTDLNDQVALYNTVDEALHPSG
jgi:anti-sigma B factor antagonist